MVLMWGMRGPIGPLFSHNWPSSLDHSLAVEEFIQSYIELGVIEGPLDPLPPDLKVSPLGAFTKRGKTRVIHDLSHPSGVSVNDFIDRDLYSVRYSSIKDAVRLCEKFDSPWLAKTDLKAAYMSCFIRPEDRNLLGFSWVSGGVRRYYRMATLSFGLASACSIFEDIANCLNYAFIIEGASKSTIHYLDDVLSISGDFESCRSSIESIVHTCRKAGFTIQDSKTLGPLRTIEFLGIVINTIDRTLQISAERLDEIRELVLSWTTKAWASKREVLSLLGKLNFSAQVVHDGSKFTRRLVQANQIGI